MAEAHEGFLLWGSAPATSSLPRPLVRVDPATLSVTSHSDARGERTINATVAGGHVTVVMPLDVLAVLEHEWLMINTALRLNRTPQQPST